MPTYFPEVKDRVQFEGPDSKNPLSFKHYNADEVVAGKTMADHFRFAVAYWHTMKNGGADVFGPGTYRRPWGTEKNPLKAAESTMAANFEFISKLGVNFWCFHDFDIAPEGKDFAESKANFQHMVKLAEKHQKDTGINLLWGTSCLFANRRYMNGAGTNPDAHVFAYAAAQVKHTLEATLKLGGASYVFWGGREGYSSLLNTDLAREEEQLAMLLQMAVDHAKAIGFKGQFMIEPKPCEPTKHQYDHDTATCLAFLRKYKLDKHFKMNIEANHATLAGHSFVHELAVASANGALGSVDANRGDVMLGWDTDQFPNDVAELTHAMLIILKQGGLAPGGLNFDAKVRRDSIDTVDLFYAHIGAMDCFARALKNAQAIIDDGTLDKFVADRYKSWDGALGKKILGGKSSLADCEKYILKHGDATPVSGRQEYLENLFNTFI